MKDIGFSAGSVGRDGNVDRMVKAIVDKSGGEGEFVKLADLNYSGCRGCVQLCARPRVCMMEDDATEYYQKIKEADAVVVGTPVFFDTAAAMMWAFLSRIGPIKINFDESSAPSAVDAFASDTSFINGTNMNSP